MTGSPEVVPLTAAALDRYRDAIGEVYSAAFKVDAAEGEQFLSDALDRHRRYPGFMGRLALDGAGNVLGFVYGYRGEPGQWWHELVRPALARNRQEHWLEDAFELAELAVHPDAQGRGIGSRLHDDLLHAVPQARALLSARHGDTPAMRLYRSRGWVPLVEDFRYFPQGEEVVLMGLDLGAFRRSSLRA
ncbi:MAG: GNAT family N-acetyltransferase [Thermomicrobiales bacterium]